ncbi:MAG: DUF2971 domain-containing protein [Chitinophagales bacterium]|nr:DUF2971 domain-containing protein [Chitinophagales bacterium]
MSNQLENIVNWDGFSERDLDTPVYRIFSFEKFITSLNDNSLYFVKPHLFEDPYEGFYLKKRINDSNGKISSVLSSSFFIQCWTLHKESNLMWTAYAPNKDGIMVVTTVRKILEFISGNVGSDTDFRFGKINYMSEKNILSEFGDKIKSVDEEKILSIILETLFIKRNAFREEKEVRIVCQKRKSNIENLPETSLGFNLLQTDLFNELADKIVLDPRLDYTRIFKIKNLLNCYNLRMPIEQSTLYQMPEL